MKAVENVNEEIYDALAGLDAEDQIDIDTATERPDQIILQDCFF